MMVTASTLSLSMALGLLLFGAGIVLIGLYAMLNQDTLAARLSHMRRGDAEDEARVTIMRGQDSALPEALRPILQGIARQGEKLAGTANDRAKLRRLLSMAGIRAPESLGLLMAVKYGLGAGLFGLVLFVLVPADSRFGLEGLTAGLLSLFVGTLLPEAWLRWSAARRGGRLARSVPDGLDLMVICSEAGLPLGRVFQVVSKEMVLSAPDLADEFRYTFAELQILNDRSRALQNLSERCGVAEVESMVATLIQAERYGTPLPQALRTISDESRKSLVLRLEEQAGKLPAHMSLPLMGLILPPIVAMMGAPAMIRLVRILLTP